MQQTLINLTEQAILELENKGWRFRASEHGKRKRLIVHKGEPDNKNLLRQIKVSEACDYLTERAMSNIAICRKKMGVGNAAD